jgi:signal transduction histidine kinase
MSLFFNHFFTLLTTPPGNLIYHIVLVVSIAVTLQRAIRILSSTQFPQARRTVIGLGILLSLQVIILIVGAPTGLGVLDPKLVLPPLERAVALLSLIWIIWLWGFPEPVRLADYATLLLNFLVLVLFGLTQLLWIRYSGILFNTSIFESIWQGLSLTVALLGVLGLVRRKPNGWTNGLVILLLAFIGHLVSLVWRMDGNLPGVVRLTQLVMFPLLFTIVRRFPISALEAAPVAKTDKSAREPTRERRRYSTDPKTLQALMTLAAEVNSTKIGFALTRGIAQAILADLCFLVTLTEDKSLYIACGFDLIREENLEGAPVQKDAIPLLANAIQRGRPLRLPASSTSSDLKALGQMLNLSNPGNLLSVPINTPEGVPLGGILILSPYSNRLWSAEDQDYLTNVSPLFIPILDRVQRASQMTSERDQALQQVQSSNEQAEQANSKYEQAALELDKLHDKESQSQVQLENMASLMIMQEESQKTIDSLKTQIEQMRQAAETNASSGDSAQLTALLIKQEDSQKTIEALNTQIEQMRKAAEEANSSSDTKKNAVIWGARQDESQKTIEDLNAQIEQLRPAAESNVSSGEAVQLSALLIKQEESQKTIDTLNTQIEQMRQAAEANASSGEAAQLTALLITQEESQKTIDTLNTQIEQMRQAADAETSGDSVQIAALLDKQEEYRVTIESLETQIEQMRQTGEVSEETADSAQLEGELHNALEELARMQNTLAEANTNVMKLQDRPSPPITSEQVDVIASISQELRQPMSSIIGYTDLLMGESVGVLGALQRKFIERIKASTDRIGGLVNDLIQITNLETGRMEFKAESIDLNLIIDNAMAYTSAQIREKNITLRLDIPDSALLIRTDRDAFQQILIHLLQNATGATQVEGVVTLRVQIQSELNEHFISIQVTDTGGGIASADIPRVFARRYHADHGLIQGLGDTGVGLSIAKALVEAQGGRIWVETEAGCGSTFSILLPVLLKAEEEK